MLENFIFENHLGQRFVGLENGVYLNYNDLRDYSWSYDTINNVISRFYRPVTNRKLPLVIACNTEDEAIAIKNQLMELAEKDIIGKRPGRVWIGDYYTNGYITASKKTNYLINKRLCYIELTLTSDDPAWYKETTYNFIPTSGESFSTGGTDNPYDYPYDYALSLIGKTIVNNSICDNPFKLRIYGAAENPSVNIGGHIYTVNGLLNPRETLLIDSLHKTITLTNATGSKFNWFDKRGRENYIFEPIPPGMNTVSWSGAFAFDLTVIEKRSEPKWT